MRQAIVTKYIGPTNTKGSRVKATAQAGSIMLHWDDALNVDQNHVKAALALAKKFKWLGEHSFAGGELPDGKGFAFVICDESFT